MNNEDTRLLKALDKFYYNCCLVTESKNTRSILATGKQILSRIQKESPYRGEIIEVGSFASKVPSYTLSECDLLLKVQIEGEPEKTTHEEYIKYKLSRRSISVWKDCCDTKGYLIPTTFARKFYTLVEKYLPEECKGAEHGPLELKGVGTVAATIYKKCPGQDWSLDLVPCVQSNANPSFINPTFMIDKAGRLWPKTTTIQLFHQGLEFVSKPHYRGNVDGWRLSFSHVETQLVIDAIETFDTFSQLMVILKTIRQMFLCSNDPNTTPILTSYHIKTLMLIEADKYCSKEDWQSNKLVDRFRSVISNLVDCTNKRCLKHFFLPNVNLFEERTPHFLLNHEFITNTVGFMENAQHKNRLHLFTGLASYKPD